MVYISKGDIKTFNLKKYEIVNHWLIIYWIEINDERREDDYYRNKVLPEHIKDFAKAMTTNHTKMKYLSTFRIDSDDIWNPYYINLSISVSKNWAINKKNEYRSYFYYPCVTYSKENKLSTRIWPESSFVFWKIIDDNICSIL